MSGHSDIAGQVAEFFAERGLLPIVSANPQRVHAAFPGTPLQALCTNPAVGVDLARPPCRGCTKAHIYLRLRATNGAGDE